MPQEKIAYSELQERLAAAQKKIGEIEAEPSDADTAGLALVGGGYVIGNIEFAPITMSTISLLQTVGSPFLGGGDDDAGDDVFGIDLQSVIESLYVMAGGVDAVRPLISLKHRVKAAAKMEMLAKSKPEYFVAYMSHIDTITDEALSEFCAGAAVFAEALGAFNFNDAVATVDRMFADAMDGFNMLPETSGDEKKTGDSTGNGSRELVV